MNKPSTLDSMVMAGLCLDCMEEQKDKLNAMLIAIRDAAPPDDLILCRLVDVAHDILEDHRQWYQLRECLGLVREVQP